MIYLQRVTAMRTSHVKIQLVTQLLVNVNARVVVVEDHIQEDNAISVERMQ